MTAVLLALEQISVAPAGSIGYSSPGEDEDGGGGPPWHFAPHVHFRRRYESCTTDAGRREVLEEALEEIRRIRYARRPKIDAGTLEGRLTIGRDTRPARIVATVYGYSIQHVYRLRQQAREHDRRTLRALMNAQSGVTSRTRPLV